MTVRSVAGATSSNILLEAEASLDPTPMKCVSPNSSFFSTFHVACYRPGLCRATTPAWGGSEVDKNKTNIFQEIKKGSEVDKKNKNYILKKKKGSEVDKNLYCNIGKERHLLIFIKV